MQNFKDKVVALTGGNSGIGLAAVNIFLERGAKVAVLDIRASEGEAKEELLKIKTDITSDESVNEAIKTIVEKWGTIDVLVNCAGISDGFEKTDQVTDDVWTKCFSVNVTGPFQLIRAVIPIFRKAQKGSIVNVGSVASVRAAAAGCAYTASKHALLGLSRSTAWMYAKENIRCNCVFPGGTLGTNITANSGMTPSLYGFATVQPYQQLMPGYCKPSDLGEAIVFLAGAEGLNGAELAVDKGWSVT